MATPRQIFQIYEGLYRNAETVRDFQIAQGEKVSGTVNLMLKGDRAMLLSRWCDEMVELGEVLQGLHDDPYIVEATQCFYWASLYTVTGGVSWDEIGFDELRQQAAGSAALSEVGLVLDQVARIRELDPEQVKPSKLFLLWWAMDKDYRHNPRFPQKRTIEEIMKYDLYDMQKRAYLKPIIDEVLQGSPKGSP